MNPYLTLQNNPHVQIEIALSSWKKVDCLIDTGFSGGVVLSKKFKTASVEKPVAFQKYELADGSITEFELYQIKTKFKDKIKDVLIFFTNSDENLVGMEFLNGYKFFLDLQNSKVSLI